MTQHQAPEVTSELLECPNPWCFPSDELPPDLRWTSEAYVECGSCGMQGPSFSPVIRDEDGDIVGTRDAEAEAITAWNTRATQPLSLTVDEIRIAEREACAKVAERIGECANTSGRSGCCETTGEDIAAAIRARS